MSDNDDDEKRDLTRIEDLAEFLHDESDDALFEDDSDSEETTEETPALPSLDDLEASSPDEEEEEEAPPEFSSTDSLEDMDGEDEVDSALESTDFSSESFGESEFAETDENDPFADSGEFSGEFTLQQEDGQESEEQVETTQFNDDFEDQTSQVDPEKTEILLSDIDETDPEQEIEEESVEEPQEEPEEEPLSPAEVQSFEEVEEVQETPRPQQNFEDLRQFAERISYGAVAQGGNPPFSLILRGIRFQEDAEDILIILREHGLVSDENEQSIEQGLSNGSLLISQISEYSAIYLAHRFRRFDLDVLVGLSDEIHPSQSYDADARGLVSKQSIKQNIHESIELDRAPVKIQNIMLATTPTLEGYTIREYLGVISHHSVLSASEIEEFSPAETSSGDDIIDAIQRDLTEVLEKHGTHDSETLMPFGQGLEALYKQMADALRSSALKIGANAIVGINYQLTPVIRNQSGTTDIQYKVTCLGSAVWALGN